VKHPHHRVEAVPLCPSCSTHAPMAPSAHASSNHGLNELQEWRCPHCTHIGMTARSGMQLVFRGGKEYVFAYGSSNAMLTVALSSEAIALFKSHHMGPDELARQTAEWALLRGSTSGTVTLGLQHEELAAFYWYFFHSQTIRQKAV
jgi:hypothetical protein